MSVCWCSVCVLSFVNYLQQNKPKTSIPKGYFQGIFKNMFANTKQMTWIIMDPSQKLRPKSTLLAKARQWRRSHMDAR